MTGQDKIRIMLVDDDETCLNVIGKALNLFDYPNTRITDSREALDLFRKEDYDLVITDFLMPGINGIELLKAVREYNSETRVVIMTGYADTTSAIDALNHGADAFLCKPLEIKKLIELVSRFDEERERRLSKQFELTRLCLEFRELEKSIKPFGAKAAMQDRRTFE